MGCGASRVPPVEQQYQAVLQNVRTRLRVSEANVKQLRRVVDRIDLRAGSVSGSECVVCMSSQINTAILPCGHACMCHECAGELMREADACCPLCRAKMTFVSRIFLPNVAGAIHKQKRGKSLSETWS